MYAPRQYRPEKRRPDNKFLTTENPEHEGPVMAPPAFSETGEKNDNRTDDERQKRQDQKDKAAGKPAGSETAVGVVQNKLDQNGTAQFKEAESEGEVSQKKEIGRSENPPQFKLAAGAPFQFKFAAAPMQMKAGASGASGGGSSNSLPDDVKAKMEGSMGADFSDVKIKANSSEAKSAGALAFAQGNEVHFAPGQFSPNTPGGQELIGHELAHVVQQRQGRVKPTSEINGKAVNDDKGLEAEADSMGAKAAQFKVDSNAAPAAKSTGGGGGSKPAQMKLDPKAFSITGKDDSVEENKTGAGKEGKEGDKEEMPIDRSLAGQDFGTEKGDQEAKDKQREKNEAEQEEREDKVEDKVNEEKREEGSPQNEDNSGQEQPGQEPAEEANKEASEVAENEAKAGESEGAEGDQQKEGEDAAQKQQDAVAEKANEGGDGGAGGGGDAGAGNGGGGDAGANAGGGAGGGAGAGGNAGGGAGAGAGGKGDGVKVAPKQMGNFGAGKEPDMMVVNDAALNEFDANSILKSNGDGSHLVIAGNVPPSSGVADTPIQMVGDPDKDKPKKKPVPKAKAKAATQANREKVKAELAAFESQAGAEIAGLLGVKGSLGGRVNSSAAAAKSSISATAAAERAKVNQAFESLKAQLLADAERVKSETRSVMEATVAAIQSGAAAAKANVESAFQAQDAAFAALEPATKQRFTAAFDKGAEDMNAAATELGAEAIKIGEEKAAKFEKEPIPEQNWAQDLANGGDYQKNKHKAKVEAARSVAKSYQEQFLKKAQEEAANLKGSGQGEMDAYVANSVQASRQGIAQRKQAAIDQITQAETGAIQSVQSNCEAMCAGIDSSAQQGVQALTEAQNKANTQIDATEQGKLQAVDQVAQEKTANLESQVQTAVDALQSMVNQTVTSVSSANNPNLSKAKTQISAALANVQKGAAEGKSAAEEGLSATAQGLDQQAAQTAEELSQASTAHIQGGEQAKAASVTALEAQRDSFKQTAESIQSDVTSGMAQSAESAANDMKAQYDAVKADFDTAVSKLEAKIGENSAAFKQNIQTELTGLPQKIEDEAKKAADAVQPRWKAWLLAAIDILVVILITAVVLVAMASGVGIIGLLLIGAVAGAVGGMIKYGAKCALTNEEFSLGGLANAAVSGAVEGLNIAAGAAGLGPLAQIGIAAAGGAIKYMGEVAFTDKEFSFGGLLGGVALGALEGTLGAISGGAGDKVSGLLTKKIGEEAMEKLGNRILVDVVKTGTEAFVDTVGGGIQAVAENYVETGTIDMSKFTDELTVENFLTNAATSKITDVGSEKLSGGVIDRYGIGKDNNSSSGSDGNDSGDSTTTHENTTTTENNSSTTESNTTTHENTNSTDGNNTTHENTTTNEVTNKDNNPTPETTPTTETHNNQGGDGNNSNKGDGDSNVTTNETTNKGNEGENSGAETTNTQENTKTQGDDSGDGGTTTRGQEQADALGYPKAPEGYQWVAKADGTPYLRREGGRSKDLPPVKYDPATGRFTPDVPAPDGYHWKLVNGQFIVSRNPNMADSLPALEYDPTTGGFRTKEGGATYDGDISSLEVRGQDFDGFTKTVDGLDADPELAKQAYELYAKKDWAALEKLFTEKGLNGGWPPNRGFIDRKPGQFEVGAKFDRFGGYIDADGNFQDKGTFVADYGADFGGRALPQSKLDGDAATGKAPDQFKGYEVLKPIPTIEGDAIPWFGQPGGGKQYELPMGITKLIEGGYIREIAAPNLHGGDGTTNKTGDGGDGTDGNNTSKVDPTKTDGGDGTDGASGGTKGANVYEPAPSKKKRIGSDETRAHSEIASTVSGNLPGMPKNVTITHNGDNTFSMDVNGTAVKVTIEIARSTSDYQGNGGGAHHGGDGGPAYHTNTVRNADGTWSTKIVLNGDADIRDINKLAGHEFSEVAHIVDTESVKINNGVYGDTPDNATINGNVAGQTEAGVFKNGGSTDPKDLTAHDKAFITEMAVLANEVSALRNKPNANKDDRARLAQLEQSMARQFEAAGISGMNDPKMGIFFSNAKLDSGTRKMLTTEAFAQQVKNDAGRDSEFNADVISHLLYADGSKNTSPGGFAKMGVNGGHVTNDLLRLGSEKVPGTDTPKYKFTEMGTATISTPDGTFVVRKFKQEMFDTSSGTYITSNPQKATFDSPNGMIKTLSGVYEANIAPGLQSHADDNNADFSYVLPDGVVVSGFADIKAGRTPKVILRSIYLDTNSY